MKTKTWNILSLFDGISCCQLALNQLGITNYNYYASEIDEYAMKISHKNYPNTIQLGSVINWKEWKLPKLDLIIAGFPCQDLSIAKKNAKGLEGKRSSLFWYFKDIVDFYNPRYFVGENVESMKTKDFVIISNALGVKPVMLDAAKVSPQRRKRYFWTNIPNVKQPKVVPSRLFPDNKIGLVIADILEPDAERKVVNVDPERIIKTSYGVRWNVKKDSGRQSQNAHFDSAKGKTIDATFFGGGYRIVRQENGQPQGQSAQLTSEKDFSLVSSNPQTKALIVEDKNCEAHRAYALHNKHAVVVGSRTNSKTNIVNSEYRIERLTWTEIERLQGLPDGYTDLGEGNKIEQRGRAIGNGFQIDVIRHLLSYMLNLPKPMERSGERLYGEQPDLFS